nr:MAG TPA: hypothetical protein [Caudoviricetes sp.]
MTSQCRMKFMYSNYFIYVQKNFIAIGSFYRVLVI